MYDPSGSDTNREWIELYNDTGTPINFAGWKFFEANINHGISSIIGDGIISPGEYVIMTTSDSAFLLDYPSYKGDIYRSSFSLNNSGESFSFRTLEGDLVASVTYIGGLLASGDGNSLQWRNNQWVSGAPNPGSINNNVSSVGTQTTTTTSNQSTSASSCPSPATSQYQEKSFPIEYFINLQIKPSNPVAKAPFVITPQIIQRNGLEKNNIPLEYLE